MDKTLDSKHMQERLSFYVKRDSPLHRLNPLTKLSLALGFTMVSFLSPWYWTPHVVILLAIIPLSFLGRDMGDPSWGPARHPVGRVLKKLTHAS